MSERTRLDVIGGAGGKASVPSVIPDQPFHYHFDLNLPGCFVHSPEPGDFVLRIGGNEVLRISSTGEITFGEYVTPNEAAKQFIEALRTLWPGRFGEVKAC